MSDGRSRAWILVLAALAFLADGVGTQAMGLALPALLASWHLPRAALAVPTALGLVGFAVGALAGGFAGDRFGVFRALLASLLLMGVSTAGCGLAHDVAQLGRWRLAAGVGLGASLPVAATVIADFSTERRRGLNLAIGLACLPLGGFVVGEAAAFILPAYGWRGLFFACGAVAAVLAVFAGFGGRVAHGLPYTAAPGAPVRQRGAFTLRLGVSARDTLGLWLAFFCTVLLYYSMFSWAPAALSARGLPVAAVSRAVSAFSIGGLVGGLVTGMLLQRFGSRACLALLGAGAMACGLVLPHVLPGSGAALTPLAITIALLGATVIGIQTLLYALCAEIYPVAHRAAGLGLAVGCGRVGAIASSYTGVIALDRGGLQGFCASLVLAALIALAAGVLVSRQIPARLGQASVG